MNTSSVSYRQGFVTGGFVIFSIIGLVLGVLLNYYPDTKNEKVEEEDPFFLPKHIVIERYNSHENFVVQEVIKESFTTYDLITVQAPNSPELHVYANIWELPLPTGTPVRLLKVSDHQSGESFLLAEPAEKYPF